jgi:hypothetical protein
MSHWETSGKSDEWYTPKWIFDSFGSDCIFDMDVAAPEDRKHCRVPAREFITEASLERSWKGFVWCNPPFGKRNGLIPWLDKMYAHKHGIALTPDRTSAPWWQTAAKQADAVLFISPKIEFIRPDGTAGEQPGSGTTLFAYGTMACIALARAEQNGIGIMLLKPM